MEKFGTLALPLRKDVKKGDRMSLLTLFGVNERFTRMTLLADGEENSPVKVELEGLGEITLAIGDLMEKGEQKTIMTLFWYEERAKDFEILRDAKAGEVITLNFWI